MIHKYLQFRLIKLLGIIRFRRFSYINKKKKKQKGGYYVQNIHNLDTGHSTRFTTPIDTNLPIYLRSYNYL